MAAIRVVRNDFGNRFQIRWRPHPADDEQAVTASLKQYPGVDLSRGRSLEEDVAWADLIITTISSAIVEFMLAGIPVFLHVTPARQYAPDVACFTKERQFFRACDLREPFAQCIAAMDRGDQSLLDPEKCARAAFFGPTGEPVSLFNLLSKHGQVAKMFEMSPHDGGVLETGNTVI